MIGILVRRREQAENEVVQETDTAARLAFANHMNRFVAGDRAPSSPEGAKMLACTHPAFDGPVILFQDVIKILHRSMSTLLFQNLAGFELNDRWRITGVLVGVDDPRRGMVFTAQGFG